MRSSRHEEPWVDKVCWRSLIALQFVQPARGSCLDSHDRIVSEGKGGTDFLRTVKSQYPLSRRQLGIKQTMKNVKWQCAVCTTLLTSKPRAGSLRTQIVTQPPVLSPSTISSVDESLDGTLVTPPTISWVDESLVGALSRFSCMFCTFEHPCRINLHVLP